MENEHAHFFKLQQLEPRQKRSPQEKDDLSDEIDEFS